MIHPEDFPIDPSEVDPALQDAPKMAALPPPPPPLNSGFGGTGERVGWVVWVGFQNTTHPRERSHNPTRREVRRIIDSTVVTFF